MAKLVHATAEIGFKIRVHREVVFDVGARVANRKARSAAVTWIGGGSMYGAIVVQRTFAGFKAELDGVVGAEIGTVG
jgi:hypothetical protein